MSETINSYTSSELLHGFRIQPYRTKTFHHMMCDARHSETPNTAILQRRERGELAAAEFYSQTFRGTVTNGRKEI